MSLQQIVHERQLTHAVMIKVIDTLVAEFAVHGMIGDLRIANPTLFHGFRRQRSVVVAVTKRIACRVKSLVRGRFFLLCLTRFSRMILFQVFAQMGIHWVNGECENTVIDGSKHETEKDDSDGNRCFDWHDRGNKYWKLDACQH
jgi:hypothetical protein